MGGELLNKAGPGYLEETLQKVIAALKGLEYGEVVIKVQGGKPIWVDRHERSRVG